MFSNLIAPSLLAAPPAALGDGVRLIQESGADSVHIDIMDGHFVPNLSFGPHIVAALRPLSPLPFDVHLMVEPPENFIAPFIEAGADWVTIHAEATPHANRLLALIRSQGKKAGISVCPGTPASFIEDLLPFCDLVLVMTVNPGFGGQKYIPEMADKVARLAALRRERGLNFQISVDGGIDEKTAPLITAAGANILVTGSAFYTAPSPASFVEKLRTGT
jgi:ribulose-phosphate 3-epimerase